MGGIAKGIMGGIGSMFGGGGDSGSVAAQVIAPPIPPPVAPPAYSKPSTQGDGAAGNVSNSARAAGAFSDTIITGPEGLKTKENTSSTTLKTTLGS